MKYFTCALALLLSACATTYGPNGLTGGYQDKKVDDDSYIVSFYGNGHTSEQKVWNYWIYRCAELTLEKGYTLFTLEQSDDYAVLMPPKGYELIDFKMLQEAEEAKLSREVQYYTVNITTYSSNAIVHMYKTPLATDVDPMQLLDAQYIIDQLTPFVNNKAKAKIKAPDRTELLIRSTVEVAIKAGQLNKEEAERFRAKVL